MSSLPMKVRRQSSHSPERTFQGKGAGMEYFPENVTAKRLIALGNENGCHQLIVVAITRTKTISRWLRQLKWEQC